MKRVLGILGIMALIAGGLFSMSGNCEDEPPLHDPLAMMETRRVDEINPTGRQYPGGRGADQLIVYTPEYGTRTGTNEYGVEALVVQDVVVRMGGNDSEIPENGFVLSGHGTSREWMHDHIKPGRRITLDRENKQLTVITDSESRLLEMRLEISNADQRYRISWEQLPQDIRDIAGVLRDSMRQEIHLASLELNQQNYEAAGRSLDKLSEMVHRYWALASPSPLVETRGFWDRLIDQSPEGIAELMDSLAEAGVNLYLPETLYNGGSLYPSEVVPQLPQFEGWDPLAVLIQEGHQRGIEIHAWVENLFVGFKDSQLVAMHPEWLMKTRDGKRHSTLEEGYHYFCWSRPEARQLILDYYKEMVLRYPELDGLQLDYIRFPLSQYGVEENCYCDHCRSEFKKVSGLDPMDLTPDMESEWDQWGQWRMQLVTDFVERVHRELKALNPRLQLSAAVFPATAEARSEKFQNWAYWVEQGWLDFLCPMIYSHDIGYVENMTRSVMEISQGKTEVYPGLGSFMNIPPLELIEQINRCRDAGVNGVVLFAWISTNPEQRRMLREGPFRSQAVPYTLISTESEE